MQKLHGAPLLQTVKKSRVEEEEEADIAVNAASIVCEKETRKETISDCYALLRQAHKAL